METKHNWKSEPWQRKEPESRLTAKQKAEQEKSEYERAMMEKKATQRVRVYCNKNMFLPPGLFTSFSIRVSIPLRKDEFMERMQKAFPELKMIGGKE